MLAGTYSIIELSFSFCLHEQIYGMRLHLSFPSVAAYVYFNARKIWREYAVNIGLSRRFETLLRDFYCQCVRLESKREQLGRKPSTGRRRQVPFLRGRHPGRLAQLGACITVCVCCF